MIPDNRLAVAGLVLAVALGGAALAPTVAADAGTDILVDEAQIPADAGPDAGDEEPGEANSGTVEDADDNETVETVSGTIESTDGEGYRLDGLRIDIGAAWYVNDTEAPADFDGDGTVETIRAEFDGLVGEDVTLTVETDGEEGDILGVEGTEYRQQGPPPWAGGPNGNGP